MGEVYHESGMLVLYALTKDLKKKLWMEGWNATKMIFFPNIFMNVRVERHKKNAKQKTKRKISKASKIIVELWTERFSNGTQFYQF